MALQWDETLETGVETIDSQHREIFSRFNDFAAACNGGEGASEVARLLDFLNVYVREHFEAEEALQRSHGYPGFAEHCTLHRSFLQDFELLKKELADGEIQRKQQVELRGAMIRWLILHIRQVDGDFARYLRGGSQSS